MLLTHLDSWNWQENNCVVKLTLQRKSIMLIKTSRNEWTTKLQKEKKNASFCQEMRSHRLLPLASVWAGAILTCKLPSWQLSDIMSTCAVILPANSFHKQSETASSSIISLVNCLWMSYTKRNVYWIHLSWEQDHSLMFGLQPAWWYHSKMLGNGHALPQKVIFVVNFA